jgi:hypothetical protein
MASYALSLYKASTSIYDLDMAPLSVDYTPESSYVWEEARLITEEPLAIMPPPSYMGGGSSIKSTARSNAPKGDHKEKKKAPACPTIGTISLKWKAPDSSKPSKCSLVTPLGTRASSSIPSARSSPSYAMVGVRKPNGGYGKALMRKPAKKSVSEPTPSGKGSESSGTPLRIKRVQKPQIRVQPAGFFRDSEDEKPPKGPTLASLSASNRSLHMSVRKANDHISKSVLKIKELSDEVNELRRGFREKVARVAKAVGVEHALNQPIQATPAAQINRHIIFHFKFSFLSF